jgi:uncharacterized protein (TIGR00297 family)
VVALVFGTGLVAFFLLLHGGEMLQRRTHFLGALGITVVFALLAWYARGVNAGGALAGSSVAFIMAEREVRMFALLLVVFALTLAATRWGGVRKRLLRMAEEQEGRSASQVMANLGLAAFAVALGADWYVVAAAALAELAADTSSSEIGMAYPGRTVLISTWRTVAPGTDGGMSFSGTMAGCLAAVVTAVTARLIGVVATHQAAIILYAAILGMLADSLFGALLERRGWLNNDLVNLLSTGVAMGIATILM